MALLVSQLQLLAAKGVIRQLDYQFARFIHQQSNDDHLAFIAGLTSAEQAKGNICLPLFDANSQKVDLAHKLGLYGEAALNLNQTLHTFDWAAHLANSPWVGSAGEPLPLMFDGERLYLHRFWHYETTLSERLLSFGLPMILKPDEQANLTELLDHLFARNYRYLFDDLRKNQSVTPVMIQQLVCDHLDVVTPDELDWVAIGQILQQAKTVAELSALDKLVPQAVCVSWQKVAAAVALTRRFAVISGGPGTGKTTTVTKLLAALIEQAKQDRIHGHVPTIKLVAPTGKAAARLTESIGQAVEQLAVSPELKAAIPTQASTIHRLLGAIPDSAEFRHHHDNPLHLDILVVDEASMVDLSMMHKLVDAMPKQARLILLGDKDQLSSVEAGAVLGDICSFHQEGYSALQGKLLAQLTGFDSLAHGASSSQSGMADSLCMLQKSYRFDARSGIGQLAKAINSGGVSKVEQVWRQGFEDIAKYPIDTEHYQLLIKSLVEEYRGYLALLNEANQAQEDLNTLARNALSAFARCRLLCAVREGDFGVQGLNARIERALAARKLIQVQDELWYHGRPVMVTRNDHALGLYNGDIGLCIRDPDEEGHKLKVFFELPDGSVKAVLPSRVPEHETAYAMTIHKSQGSEFDHTLMILPPEFSPILTRELIYTGVTRAKSRLSLYVDESVMARGIKVRTVRASGLTQRLKEKE